MSFVFLRKNQYFGILKIIYFTATKYINYNIFHLFMNAEISRLEAVLLNLRDAQKPLVDKMNEYNALISADVSKMVSSVQGAVRVVVRANPVNGSIFGLSSSISIEGEFENPDAINRINEIVKKASAPYNDKKAELAEAFSELAEKEHKLHVCLANYTRINQLYDNPGSHSHLIVVRDKVLCMKFDYGSREAVLEGFATLDMSELAKERVSMCTAYEITHPSALADAAYMAEFAINRIGKLARPKKG